MGWLSNDESYKTQEVHVELQGNDKIQTALLAIKFVELMLYFSRALKKTVQARPPV